MILALTAPPQAYAESTVPTPPTVMSVVKGELVPFSGVLLNPTAAAKLMVEKDFNFETCKLRIDHEVAKEAAKCNLLLKTTEVSLTSLKQKYDSVLAIKDKEIERLSAIAVEKKDYTKWWAIGGFVSGAILTVGLVYITARVEK